jgi:hypothetical protein
MELPLLKMEGRSGCRLEVLSREGIPHVRKHSKDFTYDARLLLQAEKQIRFSRVNTQEYFFSPAVLGVAGVGERAWFDMTYIHGQKFSEFFERSSIVDIQELASKFTSYFSRAFSDARLETCNEDTIMDKIASLRRVLMVKRGIDHALVDDSLTYLNSIPTSTIPMGSCHGDFTLSNMLFVKDRICLIDFLDSFIESPLMDLVKFRQDTRYYWSLFIEKDLPRERQGKIIQVLNYLDHEIVNALSGSDTVAQWYDYLQVFNLLRILPYVDDPSEIALLENAIHKINQTIK